MYNLNKYIFSRAKDINIDIIGVSKCDSLENRREVLKEKIDLQKITEFESKNLEERIEPKIQLQDCKSVISIAMSYNIYRKDIVKDCEGFQGKLSKSSWGIDYHIVLKEKMIELVRQIEKIKQFNYKIIVDTSPLLDRELASRSGIGNYGKNCSIINNTYGSFIFIGHILTDLQLDYSPYSNLDICGDCDKCLRACPTGALEKPYYINPKKCISYLTQTKEKIPTYLREKMGTQIYGCDICQEVCPKNRQAKKTNNRDFYPYKTKGWVDIAELLAMSNRDFKNKYGHKSGSWRGRNTFKRNSIIALGNMKNKEALPLLYKVLEEDDKRFEDYLKWSIKRIEG